MTDLSQYDDDYEKAETKSYGDLPEGTYQAWVERAWIDTPEWAFHPELKLQCRVIGERAGAVLFVQQSFDPEWIHHLKSTVATLNLEPPVTRASEVGERLEEMLYRVLTIKVVHKPSKKDPEKKFVNCYVQGFVGMKQELMGEGELDDLGF